MDDFNEEISKSIPEELYSEYEERPFHTCTKCGETLVDYPEGYHVAKVFKNNEAIFEYALCFSCHSGMISEFSSDSRIALENYYRENMNPISGLKGCGLCNKERSEFDGNEYSIGAMCMGMDMIDGFIICSPCMEKTNSLISTKTKGIWDKFINENFPGVPADALPSPGKLGVL
ncbi:MAG: hypothetical protein ACJ0IB_07485 [Verrucomicrobiales bacterium]|tara:strand:- start:73 stop:594 length:522 start_codon:yes stop_codon:yes gene_type:complete